MSITFTLTKQDGWNHHKYATWNALRHHPIQFLAQKAIIGLLVWLFFAAVWRLFVREFWYCLGAAFLQCLMYAVTYPFDRRRRYFNSIAKSPAWVGDWMVELGNFDLRWGNLEGQAYFYHWSVFEDVVSTKNYLYFVLKGGQVLFIPNSAFPEVSEATEFFHLAHKNWETAKINQRHALTAEEGVWPPPPRIGA